MPIFNKENLTPHKIEEYKTGKQLFTLCPGDKFKLKSRETPFTVIRYVRNSMIFKGKKELILEAEDDIGMVSWFNKSFEIIKL